MLLSATAATASVRPSDSLVSPSAVSPIGAVRQNAALAKKNDAVHTQWILIFIIVGTVITGVWIAVDSNDDEPESP